MSNDLISRKEVLGIIESRLNTSKEGTLERQRLYSVFTSVREMPTAYDVNKVVERIREFEICGKCLNNYNSVETCAEFCDVGKKLAIIKSGGIE